MLTRANPISSTVSHTHSDEAAAHVCGFWCLARGYLGSALKVEPRTLPLPSTGPGQNREKPRAEPRGLWESESSEPAVFDPEQQGSKEENVESL